MRTFAAVVVGLVLLVATAGSASAAPRRPQPPVCGQPVVTDVKLDADVACGQPFVVQGDGVTVHLARHTIRDAVFVLGNDVRLKDGQVVVPRPTAINVQGADALLDRLTVSGATGFAVEAGEGTTVRNSRFTGNIGVALDQFNANGLVVERSHFEGNGVGVGVLRGSGAVIRLSTFVGNTTGVRIHDENFSGASATRVQGNRFERNTVGIRLDARADAVNNVIEGNVVKDSKSSGILVTSQGIVFNPSTTGGGRGTVIRFNMVDRSGSAPTTVSGCQVAGQPQCSTTADDGITVLASPEIAATMVVTANRATNSAGYGIEAPNVTDGGLNSGRHNGSGDCLGLTCL
jgi:hypothetical protein